MITLRVIDLIKLLEDCEPNSVATVTVNGIDFQITGCDGDSITTRLTIEQN